MASKEFIRSDAHKKKRIARTGWRSPRGWQNKMRLHKRGYRSLVSTGYGTSAKAYNKFEGNTLVRVSSVTEAKHVHTHDVVVIASMGAKKILEVLKVLKEKKVSLVESTVEERIKMLEGRLAGVKKTRDERAAKKKARDVKNKDKEKKKAAEEKASKLEEEVSEEEQKVQEKKEKDKLLTQGE